MSELTDSLMRAISQIDTLLKSIPEEDRPELTIELLEEAKQIGEEVRLAELEAAEAIRLAKEADESNQLPDLGL